MVEGFHLPEYVSTVPLRALGSSTRQFLAIYLDPPSCTVNNDGIPPDASGLAELAGFDYQTIRYIESKSNKTIELLNMWRYRQNGTLGNLVEYLLQLERFDCLTDIWQKLLTDANKWTRRSRARDSSCSLESFPASGKSTESLDDICATTDSDSNFLTVDDVNAGQIQMYSACVCCADGDLDLARDIVRELAKTAKLFLPQDQLVGGAYEFEATAEVIEDRCDGRLVVLLSNHYTNSPACSFATQFAKTLDPDARRRRIIPVVTQEGVNFPRILRGISTIKYYRCESMTSFLTQIIASLSYKSPSGNESEALNRSSKKDGNVSTFSSKSSLEYQRQYSVISKTRVASCECLRKSSSAADNLNSNVSMTSTLSNESRITNNRTSLRSQIDNGLVSSAISPGCESLSCRSKILNINPVLLKMNDDKQSQIPGKDSSMYFPALSSENKFGQPNFNNLSPLSGVIARRVNANQGHPASKLNIGMNQTTTDISIENNAVVTQNNEKQKSSIIATLKRIFMRSQSNKNKAGASKKNTCYCQDNDTTKCVDTSSTLPLPPSSTTDSQWMLGPSRNDGKISGTDVFFV